MSEVYNLERQQNIENRIDPTGKKWEIYSIKGSALFECRPIPYNPNTIIPDEFKGRWTKTTLLLEQVLLYLNRAWDKADAAKLKNDRRNQAAKENAKAKPKQKTAKESLDELPQEVKDTLGDTISTEDNEKD